MSEAANNKYRDMTDEQLAALARSGNDDAFSSLVGKYVFTVRSCAAGYNCSGIDFEDLVQEGIIGLMNAAHNYDSDCSASFSTFARLCIDRNIISAVRASLRKKHIPQSKLVFLDDDDDSGLSHHSIPSANDNPESVFIAHEDYKQLTKKIFSRLSQAEIDVLKLYLGGYSYDAIAKILECSTKSVDNAIQRLRRKLR